MENLSSVLKRRRKELGLTLAQIANVMGVAEATVQRWESGNIKSIRYDKIAKLADLLKVSPAALMGWEDEKRPVNSETGEADPLDKRVSELLAASDDNTKRAMIAFLEQLQNK